MEGRLYKAISEYCMDELILHEMKSKIGWIVMIHQGVFAQTSTIKLAMAGFFNYNFHSAMAVTY